VEKTDTVPVRKGWSLSRKNIESDKPSNTKKLLPRQKVKPPAAQGFQRKGKVSTGNGGRKKEALERGERVHPGTDGGYEKATSERRKKIKSKKKSLEGERTEKTCGKGTKTTSR